MGRRKSRMKVSTKDEMQASLKALRRDEGVSSAPSHEMGTTASTSASDGVAVGEDGVVLLSFSKSDAGASYVGVSWPTCLMPWLTGMALMARVISQSKSSGLTSETTVVTMRPVMIAARLPASVAYSVPVVVTVLLHSSGMLLLAMR